MKRLNDRFLFMFILGSLFGGLVVLGGFLKATVEYNDPVAGTWAFILAAMIFVGGMYTSVKFESSTRDEFFEDLD